MNCHGGNIQRDHTSSHAEGVQRTGRPQQRQRWNTAQCHGTSPTDDHREEQPGGRKWVPSLCLFCNLERIGADSGGGVIWQKKGGLVRETEKKKRQVVNANKTPVLFLGVHFSTGRAAKAEETVTGNIWATLNVFKQFFFCENTNTHLPRKSLKPHPVLGP